jgi:hypothetical protein
MSSPMDTSDTSPSQGALSGLRNRREFLQLLAKGLGYSALLASLPGCGGGGSDNPPPTPAAAIPPATQDYRVLKRTSFGVTRDELVRIGNLGIEAYLEEQLDCLSIDTSALESELEARFPQVFGTPAQLAEGFPDNIGVLARQMVAVTQYRQIFSRRQLYEVMVEFWSDHFNIQFINGICPTLKPVDDRQVIRAHALGNFRDLLRASATSSAMLFYLDNFYNVASAPNENYARELMELHTLGVDGGYTETDIKEVARCFTGWTFQFPRDMAGEFGVFTYVDLVHDQESKQVLGATIPAGGGQRDGEQVIDLLASHPSTAHYLATKLCRRFISDTPDEATVEAVADAFILSDGDIKVTLRALFASEAFLSSADLKVTRPSEYLAGLIRSLAPDTAYPSDDGALFYQAQSLLGQLPFNWPTPDGYPDSQSYWVSTGGLLNRWRLSFLSFAPVLPVLNVIQVDYPGMLSSANTLAAVVDTMTEAIVMRPLSDGDRDRMLAWLTAEYAVDQDTPLPAGTAEAIAPLVAAVLVSSAYFHLR